MQPLNLLGFDFGASSGRAMLGTFTNGRLEIREIHRFSNDPVMLCGRFVWDVPRLVYEMKQALLKLSHMDTHVDAIGIDTWGVDFGLLDGNGYLLGLPVHYRDDRTLGMRERVREIISDVELFGRTGIAYNQYNTLYQLYSMKQQGDPALTAATDKKIYAVTSSVSELVHGFEFATLLSRYYHAYLEDDDETKAKVVRWFRGEYSLKSEAKEALGINMIITDDDWYDYLKLFAMFFRLAGYTGMFLMIDELVNIYKIPNSITRQYNYEKMLTMYNDTLQGKAKYLGILMGATPQALEDKRRGIYSYEALRSRLAEGRFSKPGARDMLAPVIRLEALTAEEMLVLCEKLAEMHTGLYNYALHITTEDLVIFIKIEYGRIGADQNITPREVIRDFIELLDLLYQHPETDLASLLSSEEFSYAKSEAVSDETESGFVEFTL